MENFVVNSVDNLEVNFSDNFVDYFWENVKENLVDNLKVNFRDIFRNNLMEFRNSRAILRRCYFLPFHSIFCPSIP